VGTAATRHVQTPGTYNNEVVCCPILPAKCDPKFPHQHFLVTVILCMSLLRSADRHDNHALPFENFGENPLQQAAMSLDHDGREPCAGLKSAADRSDIQMKIFDSDGRLQHA
jgi:hypothetical protein